MKQYWIFDITSIEKAIKGYSVSILLLWERTCEILYNTNKYTVKLND